MKSISCILLAIFLVACGGEPVGQPDTASVDDTGTMSDGGSDMPAADMGMTDLAPSDMNTGLPDLTGPEDMADKVDLGPIDLSPLDVMNRPADVLVPDDYERSTSYPLIVLLHGYGGDGLIQDEYFGLSDRRTEDQFVMVRPDGTYDPIFERFWNAMFCCDYYDLGPDDVAYVGGLINEAQARFNIDPARIYLFGHSNGGFMSYRMACEVDGIAAIASLAGSGWLDENDCLDAGSPVSVLEIHGTADLVIPYDGVLNQYPSAPEMMRRWASRNNCDADPMVGPSLDLEIDLVGDDTTTQVWPNCDDNTLVELWTITNGGHLPFFQPEFIQLSVEWLLSQRSP